MQCTCPRAFRVTGPFPCPSADPHSSSEKDRIISETLSLREVEQVTVSLDQDWALLQAFKARGRSLLYSDLPVASALPRRGGLSPHNGSQGSAAPTPYLAPLLPWGIPAPVPLLQRGPCAGCVWSQCRWVIWQPSVTPEHETQASSMATLITA